jgi:hypothetical protein
VTVEHSMPGKRSMVADYTVNTFMHASVLTSPLTVKAAAAVICLV